MEDILGKPIDRIDGPLKVTGKAPYTFEHRISNSTYAVLVMSTVARGRITSIETRAAERSPGVLLVMTHLNSPKLPTLQSQKKSSPTSRVLQVLQDNTVLYRNQPIAVVVAETVEAAQEGAHLVRVQYEVQKPRVSLAPRASEGYSPAKAGGGGDPSTSARGDVKLGLDEADARIEHVYETPFEVHNPMEPHATIAVWDGPEKLTLYDATQGVFSDQTRVAELLGLQAQNVRVISPYLGGGFGSKGPTWSHVILAALAAKQLNRPVKLEVTRPQMFGMLGYRAKTQQTISAGAKKDGTLTALRHDTINNTSSFDEFVETASLSARMLYSVPNDSTVQKIIKSDLGTPSFMRAPGESSGTYGLEAAMDELAYELKMDPIEFRLKNYAETDQQENKPWSSKSLRQCYKVGAEHFGWEKRKMEPRSVRNGNQLIGYGMATSVYPSRRSPSNASARLNSDGTFLVTAGTQDLGTGTYTIMTQVAAESFGVPADRVKFLLGDTRFPKTPVSGGSQTAASTGSAVYAAAGALREKIIQMAISDAKSPLYNLGAQDVALDNGRIYSKSNSSKGEPLSQILQRSGRPYLEAMGEAKPGSEKEQYSMYAFGAQFAEVHVDADLGVVTVARLVGCFGAGNILNAKTARSQLMGGMIWGISMALYEDAMLDQRVGGWVNNNLAEYHVPVNADVRQIEALWVEEEDQHINPLGAKGIGEIGITGSTAAITNAIFNATGIRVRNLPVTPDKLLGPKWNQFS
jgi:xanthine dehydrogenase YagR molybdenum-binding subunit